MRALKCSVCGVEIFRNRARTNLKCEACKSLKRYYYPDNLKRWLAIPGNRAKANEAKNKRRWATGQNRQTLIGDGQKICQKGHTYTPIKGKRQGCSACDAVREASYRPHINAHRRTTDRTVEAQRQRARKRNAEGVLTKIDWERIVKKQRSKCAICKIPCRLTIDHIIPLSKGGSHWPENIQGLCLSCNCRKGDRL